MIEPYYFVFDTETGGLIEDNPSLLTIDGILCNPFFDELGTFSAKMKPPCDYPYRIKASALEINKIDLVEHHKEAIEPYDVAVNLTSFFQAHLGKCSEDTCVTLCGQNVTFDKHFLYKEIPKITTYSDGWQNFISHRTLDLQSVARFAILQGKIPEMTCSLKNLSSHFGYLYHGAHNSMFDAELTRKLFVEFLKL